MSNSSTAPRPMRSDTIKKGIEHAPHRALLRATGVKDEDFDKPFIAIANSYIDIIPGHVHLDEFGKIVKQAVREAGGVPFLFNTIGVDDGIAMGHFGMKYSLPSREIIADAVETMVNAHHFDALICIPNCDKIVPGMLMAAMRCNIPTIFVSGGPMYAGQTADGTTVDLISVFEAVGRCRPGKMTQERLPEIERVACPDLRLLLRHVHGQQMNCLCEALGIALPGNGTILALEPRARKRWPDRRRSADRCGCWTTTSAPLDIVTPESSGQRLCAGHGDGRQHQHRPAYAGHRPRGGHRLPHQPHQRHLAAAAQYLQGLTFQPVPCRGRSQGGRDQRHPARVEQEVRGR